MIGDDVMYNRGCCNYGRNNCCGGCGNRCGGWGNNCYGCGGWGNAFGCGFGGGWGLIPLILLFGFW